MHGKHAVQSHHGKGHPKAFFCSLSGSITSLFDNLANAEINLEPWLT